MPIVERPGTDGGPCEPECRHTYCLMERATADQKCGACRQPIGYDRRYVDGRHEQCDVTKAPPKLREKPRQAPYLGPRVLETPKLYGLEELGDLGAAVHYELAGPTVDG